jgi:hypothetical protein
MGCVSDGIIQHVKAVWKATAELYEAREATQADRTMIDASRRPVGNGRGQVAGNTPYYGCTCRKSVVI